MREPGQTPRAEQGGGAPGRAARLRGEPPAGAARMRPAAGRPALALATTSSIEWTEATWNPTTGCSKVSAGCKNCYAERLSNRLRAMGLEKYRNNFAYTEHDSEVELPLRWRKPRRIFVNSMSDLFHEDADYAFVGRCFHTMLRADWHTYQVLTKRPARMAEFSRMFEAHYGLPVPPHIWMGTSVEDNAAAHRIGELLGVRCRMRFVSFEPLLENIRPRSLRGIDWAIIGGESGPRHRPMAREWVDGLMAQCRRDGVPVFFKQWGGRTPKAGGRLVGGRTIGRYPAARGLGARDRKRMQAALEMPRAPGGGSWRP